MQGTTIKKAFLALIVAAALPLTACSDNDSPTSPTQPGPPVADTPTPPTTPPTDPTPPTTPPTDPPTNDNPVVSATGVVVNLQRSGAGDLDVQFRIDDATIVRAPNGTPVMIGSTQYNTDAIRNGQTVFAEGRRSNGFLDATRIVIQTQ